MCIRGGLFWQGPHSSALTFPVQPPFPALVLVRAPTITRTTWDSPPVRFSAAVSLSALQFLVLCVKITPLLWAQRYVFPTTLWPSRHHLWSLHLLPSNSFSILVPASPYTTSQVKRFTFSTHFPFPKGCPAHPRAFKPSNPFLYASE